MGTKVSVRLIIREQMGSEHRRMSIKLGVEKTKSIGLYS